MADIVRLAREHSDITDAQLDLLRDVVADWALIADLAFADLVLWLPTWNGGGYVAVAHQRPDTGRTHFLQDVVGTFVARGRRPVMDRAMASARPQASPARPGAGTQQVYPLTEGGAVFALLGRYSVATPGEGGRLEVAYQEAADDLCAMVVSGDFPVPGRRDQAPLRVGGGLIRLDPTGIVTFASPNAQSAFRRLGAAVDIEGTMLSRVAPRLHDRPDGNDPDISRITAGTLAGRVELAHSATTLVLESLPLRNRGLPVGALLLVRDVTELRHRDRALMTKEANLREVHHRIKNNLQMVAALLRMQSRRVTTDEARGALVDAGTRIGAIAVVHEVLAASPEGAVDFDDVVDRVLAMARELAPDARLTREGSLGPWPSETATPMAMCLAELVANAVEHSGPGARVTVAVRRGSAGASVRVDDSGPGLPTDFSPERSGRLGMQIVRTLVNENGGNVAWTSRPGGGTTVTLNFRKTLTAQGESGVR